MDRNDQQAIEGLFSKLAAVERQAGPRDADADRFIQDRVGQQPGAPYFMAQTIVVQEQALEAAQRRIEELEYQAVNSPAQRGGLLSGLFGGNARPQPAAMRPAAPQQSPWGQNAGAMPMQGRAGGGFLAGAAQTAMGVAGGVLLGNAIMGMFGGDEAQAAQPAAAEEPAEDEDGGDFEM
ncbi:hypothetical protein AKG11_19145 [Shinella sp. SUS2]|jgi:hypothetical protein|uniref:DUF2076 domain-containing protein n=1 Tax=unclassified Shinella TaxID=2643062 RepID=UPI00067FD91D|nr:MULTISPECIES: DUF2076 domain-containing protein [unclassified Shinella]KNY15336.1 hypothetical protein AKG11_19145 [Shinella sp. SUS2]KOC74879.1 hypothetical protein AKG10_15335 [Shinella sp. GWS1]TAA56761.1 DUF2076 domain-containing protein [Shinella sp. JR1-6]